MGGVIYFLLPEYFTLLHGVYRSIQQSLPTGIHIARMACIFFLRLPARPFLGLVVEAASPPLGLLMCPAQL